MPQNTFDLGRTHGKLCLHHRVIVQQSAHFPLIQTGAAIRTRDQADIGIKIL